MHQTADIQVKLIAACVSGDAEARFKGSSRVYASTTPYDPDPLKGFSWRLSDPACAIVSEGIAWNLTGQFHWGSGSFKLSRRRGQTDAMNIWEEESRKCTEAKQTSLQLRLKCGAYKK